MTGRRRPAAGSRGARITVSTLVPAPVGAVWDDVRDISSHTEWMHDAVAIRFTSPGRSGVGTTFDCDTRVGPFRLTDRMEVTEWDEGAAIGIHHVGAVTGTGRFTLEAAGPEATRFTWTERLVFPWWMGGRLGAAVGAPVLRAIWRRNLRGLARRFTR
jgi:hypothetical protein